MDVYEDNPIKVQNQQPKQQKLNEPPSSQANQAKKVVAGKREEDIKEERKRDYGVGTKENARGERLDWKRESG